MAEGRTKSGRTSDRIPIVPAAKLAMPSSRTSGRASSLWISKICSAVNRGSKYCLKPATARRTPTAQKTNHLPTSDISGAAL